MMLELFRNSAEKSFFESVSKEERGQLGQFSTPYDIALQITKAALFYKAKPKTILEPACGTGAFISALRTLNIEAELDAVELDSRICNEVRGIWENSHTVLINDDFLHYASLVGQKYDLILSNPPYTRHQYLTPDKKGIYASIVRDLSGVQLSALSGLHAYFILSGQNTLKEDGVGVWLIPSEFFSLNYSRPIKDYLLYKQKILRIHFFDNDGHIFSDALVSSCVLIVQNSVSTSEHQVLITKGAIEHPHDSFYVSLQQLREQEKWQHIIPTSKYTQSSRVGDFFSVSRGIATGNNDFFVRRLSEWISLGIDEKYLCPLIPSPRHFKELIFSEPVQSGQKDELPYLLAIPKDESYSFMPPGVISYLKSVPEFVRSGYIVSKRKKWYSVELMKPAPIVCTYMGRSDNKPFRFIRNKTRAVILNTYLALYPQNMHSEEKLDLICDQLNSLSPEMLISCCREYGGGLKKMEPKELLALPFCV